jgi:hypothetical protein
MKLDYIAGINEYGDNIIRLYDFDSMQANEFRESINKIIIKKKESFSLDTVNYIEPRNCKLILRISDEDTGIITYDNKNFFCDLTMEGYKNMVSLLEPFCNKETKGYQWLYDIDSDIDFLFSPAGTW